MEARRVKVSRGGQSLMLRVPDLSVARLATVFKVNRTAAKCRTTCHFGGLRSNKRPLYHIP